MNRAKNLWVMAFVAIVIVLVVSVGFPAQEQVRLRMATTTSVDNSGLLGFLLPMFEKKTGIHVDVIAVGTGKALKLAENGDVDMVFVHDPEAEEAFMANKFGLNRRLVMINDFLIVGPPTDPAKAKGAPSLAEALKRIKAGGAPFVSRGDESGTHVKEKKLWAMVGGPPAREKYLETGQGMEETLRVAFEKRAYTLTDRGTYLATRKNFDLVPVFEGDPALNNLYSVIAVNPARYPHTKYKEAMSFINWITSTDGQKAIESFKVDGQVLFHPAAGKNGEFGR